MSHVTAGKNQKRQLIKNSPRERALKQGVSK